MAADVTYDPSPAGGEGLAADDLHLLRHLEPRPFRPFKSSEEYLYAMKEDLAEWLNSLYDLDLTVDNFLDRLETGVILCKHANHVLGMARDWRKEGHNGVNMYIPDRDVVYRTEVSAGTFHARDNVSNFITWCRSLAIKDCLLFETEDLVMRKNERSVILCLLEVARRGAMFGMPAPLLVQMEQEIDAELAKGAESDGHEADDDSDTYSEPPMQIITNDLRSLHERVVDLLNRCTCPSQFPMIRVADGKYRIGDTKVLIFVRILRNHVMVRVGGGWDTLEHYLDKHDPCRCRSGHRLSTSAKLTMSPGKCGPHMQVTYHRPSTVMSPAIIVRSENASSVPTSPHIRRRLSSHDADYPVRGPSRNSHCSDDSSTSSASVHLRDESPTPDNVAKLNGYPPPTSAESSSEVSEGEGRAAFHPGTRQKRNTPRKTSKCSVADAEELECRSCKHSRAIPGSQHGSSVEEINQIARRRSICDDRNAFKSRIPCLDPPTKKLSYQEKAKSTEDLYSINFKHRKSDKSGNYNSFSRGASPTHSPAKGRRASTGTGSMPRSQSQTYGEMDDRYLSLSRQGPGRYSCKNLRMADVRPKVDTGHKTWTFRQRSSRPSVGRETYRGRKSPCTTPKVRSPSISPDNANRIIGSPIRNKQISPLLEEMLRDDNLDSDEKILEKMEMLINQYKKKIDGRKQEDDNLYLTVGDEENIQPDQRNSNRKDSVGVSPSKIPLRVWRN